MFVSHLTSIVAYKRYTTGFEFPFIKQNSCAKSPDTRNTRRYIKHYSSFFQGVYTEFVGERTLPKALRTRLTIFIFGEDGVGKTIVARHILGEGHRLMKRQEVLDIFLLKIRRRRWMDDGQAQSHPNRPTWEAQQ